MSIVFNSECKIFSISTDNSSYILGLAADGILTHIYYGKKVSGIPNLIDVYTDDLTKSFGPQYSKDFPDIRLAGMYQEYPVFSGTDYRVPALKVEYSDGTKITLLLYKEHKIYSGKPKLNGLPAIYTESDDEAETLEIILKDKYSDMYVKLIYTVMKHFDAIIRSAEIINSGDSDIKIMSALSASMDFYNSGFSVTQLSGAWGRERHIETHSLTSGNFNLSSNRGASGHSDNPFLAIHSDNADEKIGEVYGMNLVYSGNFVVGTECDMDDVRAYIGINPFDFCWVLGGGESFQTPEAVLVYSDKGFGEMSRTYHKLYRTRLCRGKYRDSKRPVLINNWEATYFDFNEEKILRLATKAHECGMELMVLDDGWFGTRNKESGSLGDWTVNYQKLPCGIDGLAKKINDLGMGFGIWMEPEMVSPDSELYRNHPDWCLHMKDRNRSEGRSQLILDLSRADVCDYVFGAVSNLLENANISYLKWDMNRNMSEVGSATLDKEHQGEVAHRYMLGLYSILEKVTTRFPDVLFESCSGGGGRFDPGMLHYMPQVWTSDNTDAVERMYIQYGTSMVYPSTTMGAHISAVPNHQVGRITPLEMRGLAAMCGRFGYELDILALPDSEIEEIKAQIRQYHKYEEIVHKGDLYRVSSPFKSDCAGFQYISEDKNNVLLFYFNIKGTPCINKRRIKLDGLVPEAVYRNTENGQIYTGDVLMNMGILLDRNQDYISQVISFEKIG